MIADRRNGKTAPASTDEVVMMLDEDGWVANFRQTSEADNRIVHGMRNA